MAFAAGTRFGLYEVTGQIGAGGMGEVYRATDTKLGRAVAIKTLASSLAKDKDRLARFEREAMLLAALHHPHIAVVHGLDEEAGVTYLAMELVEGETLEDRLKAGALPVEDALPIALQIAGALEAAHGKGVVHRDLKPANIMLTPEGQVKVLDFGLAKAFAGDPSEASPAHSPALSLAMTQQGLVLGTAGYMSPEQASGQATDQRADIWAFGVVLYEMLTGLPLFSGESVPHILADVLKTEPDWKRLPPNLHPRLKLLLERCLTKRPRDRLHSIADARIEIEAVLGDPAGVTLAQAVAGGAAKPSPPWRMAAAIVAAAVVAGVAGWLLRPLPEPEPDPVVRFSTPLPADQSFSTDPVSMIAISRDGTRIAYVANSRLYLRNLAEREARPVPGTDEGGVGAATPTFSPDGQWLAYVHVASPGGPYTLKRVPITGGSPVTLHRGETGAMFQYGLTWPTADTMLFATGDGVVRIPANGGAAEVLVERAPNERIDSPQLLPGVDAVLFTSAPGSQGAAGTFDGAQVIVQSIGGNDRTVVWQGGSAARYLTTGHLVYAQAAALFAIPFDLGTRAVRGGPVPLIEGLRRSSNGVSDTANIAISDSGTLAMIPGNPNANVGGVETTLTWLDRNGREEPLTIRPDDYTLARISPDGTQVALVVGAALGRDSRPTIWIYDLASENLRLLTTEPANQDGPVWSMDSRRIYFRSGFDDTVGVYAIEVETGEVTLLAASPDFPFPLPWTLAPDGRTLGLINAASMDDVNIATLPLPDGELTRLLEGEGFQSEPSFSADGAWLAYSDDGEINIRPFPAVNRTRIPVGPGQSPVFSRDGSELFFFDNGGVMAAPISYEPTLRVGAPRRLLEPTAPYLWAFFGRTWDVDPGGERFLVIRQPGAGTAESGAEPERERIDVVMNWFAELESRVPID